ncbi:Glycosyltransferase, catalytic subunit of cellulose synthase and poly-beta-1,6-N-acetylglucosamine synthase [Enterococcus malodoratus]|nr:Glycosyltransferase, catalytic subunit of cellulose synthase and poly-beta-1,6-N-acetylglucosamine synthase [Enterococcus malodoratus]
MNYPKEKMEILVFADNCEDETYERVCSIFQQPEYEGYYLTKVIDRRGTGGKAGVLNDSLKIAHGDYLCVYDADAMPEKNALYFLVEKVLEDPERYGAVFGRNKTRNYKRNFLTRCINLEIVTSQRIIHTGLWQLFKIGQIPGTNFIIQTSLIRELGGWDNGALTEDTALSFKLMKHGKLIALTSRAEAFQQEPETLSVYYRQRKRWAKGNYEVIINNMKDIFGSSNWRIRLQSIYYFNTFFWFTSAIILSNIMFVSNLIAMILHGWFPSIDAIFTFGGSNRQIGALLLVNWALMFAIYLLQIQLALSSQFGQATTANFFYAIASYFTYSLLFIGISIVAFFSYIGDKLFRRDSSKWYKTQRFDD